MAVVFKVDNLIPEHMIHGTSRIHLLVALISELGALKLVGLWGIFVGPVLAGIFYALLKIMPQIEERESVERNRCRLVVAFGKGSGWLRVISSE